jgi:hypothetical protein
MKILFDFSILYLAAIFQPAFGQSVKSDSINPYGKGTIIDANGNDIRAIVGLLLFGETQDDGTVAGMLKSMEWIINQLEIFTKKIK